MPTFRVTAWSWISRPMIWSVSPKGMEAKAVSPKNTDTNGASLNISRSACAGVKSSLVSIFTASASGWSSPRMRMPQIDARLAPTAAGLAGRRLLRRPRGQQPPEGQRHEHDEAGRERLQQQVERDAAHAFTAW